MIKPDQNWHNLQNLLIPLKCEYSYLLLQKYVLLEGAIPDPPRSFMYDIIFLP